MAKYDHHCHHHHNHTYHHQHQHHHHCHIIIVIATITIKVVTIIITVRLVADLLSAAGADHVVTMDLHAGQIQVELLTCFTFCSCEIQILEGFSL